ncbi:Prefoldin-domain-containing protein [Ramicandelaber brevisporus]|nr:Prefoldin-domain-containing protein [Ramicandelaber brevisporus]
MASKASAASGGDQPLINISDLSLVQLENVKQQLEGQLTNLSSSYAQLSTGLRGFKTARQALDSIEKTPKGHQIIVPLTNALYVPATLEDSTRVTVDVGAGYYVEKSVKDAKSFYDSKISSVQNTMNDVKANGEKIENNLNTVLTVLETKQGELTQRQTKGKPAPSSRS